MRGWSLRVENDGSLGIDRADHTGPKDHGLTAVFTDRTVRGEGVELGAAGRATGRTSSAHTDMCRAGRRRG
ncbi:hypothetical protein GTY20_21380 [Streptomyces sp. SID4946]|nr:hypothetical protein [Streptomyces sp. SID4946]